MYVVIVSGQMPRNACDTYPNALDNTLAPLDNIQNQKHQLFRFTGILVASELRPRVVFNFCVQMAPG